MIIVSSAVPPACTSIMASGASNTMLGPVGVPRRDACGGPALLVIALSASRDDSERAGVNPHSATQINSALTCTTQPCRLMGPPSAQRMFERSPAVNIRLSGRDDPSNLFYDLFEVRMTVQELQIRVCRDDP